MLTAIKNVFVSYLISMSELHPEVTRFYDANNSRKPLT